MSFQIDPIQPNNPYPANAGGRVSYRVSNLGPDEPSGHQDHIQMWGTSGKPVDEMRTVPATVAGGAYGVLIDLPSLNAGYYDLSVTLPDGTATGTTVIVQ